jgi:hypothetical protein
VSSMGTTIMSPRARRIILKLNAGYIGLAGAVAMVFDIGGALYGTGPQGQVLAKAPLAAIGFIEAHGLAVILATLLWRLPPSRALHLTAAAMVALLGICNLAFWQLFVETGALTMGYVTTGLHLSFTALQLAAAAAADGTTVDGPALAVRETRL